MVDNVTAFPGTKDLPENLLQVAPVPFTYCRQDAIILDAHSRSVQCADPKCGATLDPFGYLLSNAQTISRAWSNHKHVTHQVNELVGRVEALKKEEQRLRAMIKRLQEKSGAVVTVRSRESI